MDLFRKCSNCRCYPSIYDPFRYPFISPNSEILCQSCSFQGCIQAPEEYINAFKNEELKATAPCDPGNPCNPSNPRSGCIIDTENLVVYCKCKSEIYYNLKTNSARIALKNVSAILLKNKSIPKEYIKRIKKISKESVEEIFKLLFTAKSYIVDKIYCLTHYKETFFYDFEKLKFVCDLCDSQDKRDLCLQNNYDDMFHKGYDLCKTSKTFGFTTSMIRTLKVFRETKVLPISFFYDLGDLRTSSKANLTEDGFCLSCEETFSFNLPPISIHGFEHHEICVKCYKEKTYYNDRNCPVCFFEFSDQPQLLFYPGLYEMKINCCSSRHNRLERFSIIKESLPHLTPCNHNICSECKNMVNGSDYCKECDINIYFKDCELNNFLIQKLMFTEIKCKTHIQPVTKYLIIENNYEILCANPQCKPTDTFKKKFFAVADKLADFVKLLNNLLCEKYSITNYSFLQKLPFIPLQCRYNLLNTQKNYVKNVFRYDKSIPLAPAIDGQVGYWYEQGSRNTFYLKSEVNFVLKGFIVAKAKDSLFDIKFFSEKKEISFQIAEGGLAWFFFFTEPVEIKENTFFDIELGKGCYYQIRNPGLEQLKMRLYKKYDINMDFTTKKSGDMGLGGPLLGIIIENYVWIKSPYYN